MCTDIRLLLLWLFFLSQSSLFHFTFLLSHVLLAHLLSDPALQTLNIYQPDIHWMHPLTTGHKETSGGVDSVRTRVTKGQRERQTERQREGEREREREPEREGESVKQWLLNKLVPGSLWSHRNSALYQPLTLARTSQCEQALSPQESDANFRRSLCIPFRHLHWQCAGGGNAILH